TITAGTLAIGASGVIPDGVGKGNVSISNGAFLTFAGDFDETINGLFGSGKVDKTFGTGNSTLSVGNNNVSSTFADSLISGPRGIIQNTTGTINLTKIGTGTLSLLGEQFYTGTTTVSQGTLDLHGFSASNILFQSPLIDVQSGATLDVTQHDTNFGGPTQ